MYRKLHLLSVDVAIGAVAAAVFFIHLAQQTFDILVLAGVFTGTWAMYLLDRQLDLRYSPFIGTERHKFHQKHRKEIRLLICTLGLMTSTLAFYIPRELAALVAILLVLCLVYFVSIHFLPAHISLYFKEIGVSAIYTIAVALPTYYKFWPSWQDKILIGSYFVVVWQSLMLYGFYEATPSTILLLGKYKKALLAAISIVLVGTSFVLQPYFWPYFYLIIFISATLSAMVFFRAKLAVNETYRMLVEMLFWVGLITFFI